MNRNKILVRGGIIQKIKNVYYPIKDYNIIDKDDIYYNKNDECYYHISLDESILQKTMYDVLNK